MKNLRVYIWLIVINLSIFVILLWPVHFVEVENFISPKMVPLNFNYSNIVKVSGLSGEPNSMVKVFLYFNSDFRELYSDNRYNSLDLNSKKYKEVFVIGSHQSEIGRSNLGVLEFRQEEIGDTYIVSVSSGVRLSFFSWIVRKYIQ